MFTNNLFVSMIRLFGDTIIASTYSCLFVNIRGIRG